MFVKRWEVHPAEREMFSLQGGAEQIEFLLYANYSLLT